MDTLNTIFSRKSIRNYTGAPELIIVSVKFNPSTEGAGHANAAMIDHNMALAATELGVGCVYIYGAVAAIRMKPDLLAKLHLPEGFTPSAGLAIGLTEENYVEREIPTDRISQNII